MLVSSGVPIFECVELKWNSSSFPIWVVEENLDWCPDLAPKPINPKELEEEGSDDSVGFEVSDFESLNGEGEEEDVAQETGHDLPEASHDLPETGHDLPETGNDIPDLGVPEVGVGRSERVMDPEDCHIITGPNKDLSCPAQVERVMDLEHVLSDTNSGVIENNLIKRNCALQPLGNKGVIKVVPHSGRNKGSKKGHHLSMKLKDKLWIPKQKSMANSVHLARKLNPSTKPTPGVGYADADSCNSAEEEVIGTITVGGAVGFEVANQVSKVRNLVVGDGAKTTSK